MKTVESLPVLTAIIGMLTFALLVWEFILKNYFYGLKVELLDPVSLPEIPNSYEFLPVIISNKGSKPVKITQVYLCNPKTKDGLYYHNYELPYFLEPGSTIVFFFDEKFQLEYVEKEQYTRAHIQYNFKRKDIVAKMKILKRDEKINSDISLVAAYKQYKEKKLKERPQISL